MPLRPSACQSQSVGSPLDEAPTGALQAQKLAGPQNGETIEGVSEKSLKVIPVESQEHLGVGQRSEQHRTILGGAENHRPVEGPLIAHLPKLGTNALPRRGSAPSRREVPVDFLLDVRTVEQVPMVQRCQRDDRVRRACERAAGGEQDTRVEEDVHRPARKAAPSASSSLIQAAICSALYLRGSGILPVRRSCWPRRRNNSCCSSGLNCLAADSISARVLMVAERSTPPAPSLFNF